MCDNAVEALAVGVALVPPVCSDVPLDLHELFLDLVAA
jgi:hypothetical protein